MSLTQPSSYIKSHITQLRTLFNKHFNALIIISSYSLSSLSSLCTQLTPSNFYQQNIFSYYYIPSLLKLKFYSQVKQILYRKQLEQFKVYELCWLIIAKAQLRENYFIQKNMLKQKYGEKYIRVIDKWLNLEDKHQLHTKQYVERPINKKIQQNRQHFQYLNHKTTKYGYFNIKQVPVYLISTQWLAKFYETNNQLQQLQQHQRINQSSSQSLSLSHLPPIDNRHLASSVKYIQSDPQYLHYNYQILTSKYKQNMDYKLISPQSWEFLYSIFSGIQLKRFTTSQPSPSVQISYRKLNIHILQNRYFHLINLQLLVSRFDSFNQILKRLKRLIITYKILSFDKLSKQVEIIKVNKMNIDQIIDFIHDGDIEKIDSTDQRFEKVDLQLDVEQAKIYTIDKQQMIINIFNNKNNNNNNNNNNLFSQIKTLKTIITRQKCLNCGNHDNITLCICKSVHFCSDICLKQHKQHAKQCQRIRKQQLKLTKLLSDYQVIQTQIKLTNQDILKKGKVGLQNLRNTCYLNSALQCILRVDKLVQYFANNDHIKDLNVDNVLGSQGHLACAFGQLIKTYFITNKRSIEPINVLRIIAKNPQFRGSDHQDSQQFLNYFLDKLHEDLNRVKKKPYTQEIQSNGRPDQIVSKQSWQNYLKRNQSFIQQLFTGQYRSQIRCPDCKRISITFDPFMSVTLQFPKPQQYFQFKGYVLSIQGQYQKVQLSLPASIKTQLFLSKTFNEQLCVVNIQKKLIKKQWNNGLKLQKNYEEDGTVLIYIKEKQWEKIFDLQFVDEKRQMIGFNRRIYIKEPDSKQKLMEQLYKHLRKPIQKALKNEFQNIEEYLQYCQTNKIIQLFPKCQQQLQFPLSQQINYTLILRFNPGAKFLQKIKLNVCPSSYQIRQQYFNESSSTFISLSLLIQNFKTPQLLSEDNMWYCSICKQHKMAQKQMKIFFCPQFLIIHLKRFNHKNTRYRNLIGVQKIQTQVKLQSIQQINNQKYQLLGIVNHFGSMTYGHYTAYVKKDEWVTYDDEKVKKCSVNGQNAYLLIYKKISNINK